MDRTSKQVRQPSKLQGVWIKPLTVIEDARGKVMHMLRSDSEEFSSFGEVYFSVVYFGFVKGWKKHLQMTQHFAVPLGDIKLVLYDDRLESSTYMMLEELWIGERNYCLVHIPAGIWYSFAAENKKNAIIVNVTNIPYSTEERKTMDLMNDLIPYRWIIP